MAAVVHKNLNSAPYEVVFGIVDDRNNIKDPRSSYKTNNRKFIYDTDPLVTAFDFSCFPHIICEIANKESTKHSVNKQSKEIIWTQNLTIRTIKNGSGNNREDSGIKDMLSICDDIDETFNKWQTRSYMLSQNLTLMDAKQIQAPSQLIINDEMVLESVYEIKYRSRMRVYDDYPD